MASLLSSSAAWHSRFRTCSESVAASADDARHCVMMSAVFTVLPLVTAVLPAIVSSKCDMLEDNLNRKSDWPTARTKTTGA